jgi:hypothetical protein
MSCLLDGAHQNLKSRKADRVKKFIDYSIICIIFAVSIQDDYVDVCDFTSCARTSVYEPKRR